MAGCVKFATQVSENNHTNNKKNTLYTIPLTRKYTILTNNEQKENISMFLQYILLNICLYNHIV